MQKILLVDDEEGIRKVLRISLMDSGYEVLVAKNGEEALQIFAKTHPSIVLTDIKMPGMDGIELLKKIKKEDRDTEVIMITGHGDMELAIQSLKYDATDFITKPIEDEILEIALKRAEEKIFLKAKLKEYTTILEQLVEEKTRQLLEAERMAAVGETVAGLAHAIKNITGGLTGGIFVLEKGMELADEKYLEQGWKMVRENVLRVKRLALDLLNYSIKRELNCELCDPKVPMREVFELVYPRVREYGVDLKMEVDDKIDKVWFDHESIHRALLNLVTNAIDACAEEGDLCKHSEVIIRCLRVKGWAVEYQVEDNGGGMDEETKRKVFQRFFSTKGSRGTGLGLMLTKKIIDEHGGIIELESDKGKGSKFILRLPEKDIASGQ